MFLFRFVLGFCFLGKKTFSVWIHVPDFGQVFKLQPSTGGVPICHLQPQHARCTLGLLMVFWGRDVPHLLHLQNTWTHQLVQHQGH